MPTVSAGSEEERFRRASRKTNTRPNSTGTGAPQRLRATAVQAGRPAAPAGSRRANRVLDRLSRASNSRFVSVVAPPGYGKTTALAQWAARDGRQFAWVSLDHRDNDPVVFLTYVAEALNADGTVAPAVFKALTGPDDSVWTSGLPRLGTALASRTEPLVLVLDDVHELENHGCLDALVALLPHVPSGSQLVLSGRTEVRLGLPKLRADGELLELGPAALALNDAEAHALLAAAGVDVTEAEAEELNEHAEGWAAGLYLAALSLSGGASSLATFGGDDRFVTDYLRSEELANVEPAELDFLLRTVRPRPHVRLRSATRCSSATIPRRCSSGWSTRTCSSSRSTISATGIATTTSSGRCFRPSSSDASPSSWPPESEGGFVVRGERPAGGRDRVLGRGRRHRRGRPARHLVRVSVLPQRPGHHPGALVRAVRRSGAARAVSRDRGVRGLDPRVARPARRGRALGARGRDLPVRTARCPMGARSRPGRPRSARCSAERRRADADRRRARLVQPAADEPLARPSPSSCTGWRCCSRGTANERRSILDQAAEAAVAGGAIWAGVVARSERALLALERGDLAAAESELALAGAFVDDAPSPDYVVTAILLAVTARVAIAKGQGARARTDARERPAPAPAADARAVLVRGPGPARAREGASGPLGRTRRGDAPPARQTTSFADARARHARRRGRASCERDSRPSPSSRRAGPRR